MMRSYDEALIRIRPKNLLNFKHNLFEVCDTARTAVCRLFPLMKEPLCIKYNETGMHIQRYLHRPRTTVAWQRGYTRITKGIQPGLLIEDVIPSLPTPVLPIVITWNENPPYPCLADPTYL